MPITAIEIRQADECTPATMFHITKEQPSSNGILFVSPARRDQADLRRILSRTHRIIVAATCRRALRRIREGGVQIVLCDRDLPDGTWVDILGQVADSGDPPLLIVTSRVADERLWAEVLNLGGFDVIAKPFAANEVLHVLSTAAVYRRSPRRSAHFAGGA